MPAAKTVLALPVHEDNSAPKFPVPLLITNQQFPSSPFHSVSKPILSANLPADNPTRKFSVAEIPPTERNFMLPINCVSNSDDSNTEHDKSNNRKISENKNSVKTGFCYHIGVLIFARYLNLLQKSSLGACKSYVMQWLVAVLIGAKNIEQSKLLNYKSLDLFLDCPIKNLHHQRTKLIEFATEDNITKLLTFNAALVDVNKETDFYYDPHTKHYTGLLDILKSWCSKARIATKVINTDFIHTADGYPVYLKNGDTFEDMRVRFFKDIKQFRRIAKMSDNKIITISVDRGIFSAEIFEEVIKIENLHIITWEKGYKRDKWDEKQEINTGSIIQLRNNKTDTKLITYWYQEYRWDKNHKIRQLIVRIPEKNGDGLLEVSILTDDLSRAATEIIFKMFKRWVQENDFKYIIAHFGFDQITSYLFNYYKDIADTITDKEHISGEYKALTKELDKLRKKLKTVLHKKHEFDSKFGIYEDISVLTKGQNEMLIYELTKELTNVKVERGEKSPSEKQEDSYKKNISKIVNLTNEYQNKFKERADTDKNVSKIDELTERGTQKLNTAPKQFMDMIKIIARNIFYLGFEPFKEKYNNYRDDHVIFREITCSDGKIEINKSEMIVDVLPIMESPPRVRKILSEIFDEINRQNIPLPKDENIKIKLKIPEKIEPFFAFEN